MFKDIKYEFVKINKKNLSFHLTYSSGSIVNKDIEIKFDDLLEEESLNDQISRIISESILQDKRNDVISFFKTNEGQRIPFFFFKEGEILNHDIAERDADIYITILEVDNVNVKIRPYSSLFKKKDLEYDYKVYNIDEFIIEDLDIKDALLKRCESDIVNILNSEKDLNLEKDLNNVSIEIKNINFIN